MKDLYYCPECYNALERLSGCGAVGYMCHTCKKLISRQKILTYEEMQKKKISNIKSSKD